MRIETCFDFFYVFSLNDNNLSGHTLVVFEFAPLNGFNFNKFDSVSRFGILLLCAWFKRPTRSYYVTSVHTRWGSVANMKSSVLSVLVNFFLSSLQFVCYHIRLAISRIKRAPQLASVLCVAASQQHQRLFISRINLTKCSIITV